MKKTLLGLIVSLPTFLLSAQTLVPYCEVLDRSMRSIMPKGFRISSPFFHQFSFEKTGLVVVWQALSPKRRPPPPSVVPDKPTAPKSAEPVAKEPQVVVDPPPVEDASAAKYACGIINAQGEWVRACVFCRFRGRIAQIPPARLVGQGIGTLGWCHSFEKNDLGAFPGPDFQKTGCSGSDPDAGFFAPWRALARLAWAICPGHFRKQTGAFLEIL